MLHGGTLRCGLLCTQPPDMLYSLKGRLGKAGALWRLGQAPFCAHTGAPTTRTHTPTAPLQVSEIETTFGVDASAAAAAPVMMAPGAGGAVAAPVEEEKTTFDVVLDEIPADKKVRG